MPKKPKSIEIERYGVGEWYGHIVSELAPKQRAELSAKAKLKFKAAGMACPFKQGADAEQSLCNKNGGVCSLVPYRRTEEGEVVASGKFVTVCPNRFWHDAAVFRWVAETVLGTSKPILVREVDFLESVIGQPSEEEDQDQDESERSAAVGRIDSVLMHPDDNRIWCALELQAVYFSGSGMGSHLAQFSADLNALPWPDKNRRPDWRSSGPKRLMPQLMTKIPTLRRWGKRMTVVIDTGFFASMGPMRRVKHLSNSDIIWFVIDYDPKTGTIKLIQTVPTTLEDSVEALTAGVPLSQEQFEGKLKVIVESNTTAMKKKVVRLM